MEEDTELETVTLLSEKDLDTLQWAKEFLNTFEDKEGLRASINRQRQLKYF